MPLAVVALATFSAVDRRWLAELAALYGPADAGLGPHFPLLALPDGEEGAAPSAVADIAAATVAFACTLRTAAPGTATDGSTWQVDLLPDDGEAELAALHTALAAALGGAAAFTPHLPVARADRDACEGLAAHLSQQDLEVAGRVTALAVVQCDAAGRRVVARYPLQS